MNTDNPIIQLKNIKKIYGKNSNEFIALNNINLNIYKKEMIAIMGPSGSGKSTLLNIIGLLDTQTTGTYNLYNKSITMLSSNNKANLRNTHFGFVVQDFALIENYSVQQNIELPLVYSNKKLSKHEKNNKIKNVLELLSLTPKRYELASNLSGGQRQRVAIARAIINNPEIILADEPTGALDSKTSQQIMNTFKQLNSIGKTIIIITHDKTISSYCNKIINIKDGTLI